MKILKIEFQNINSLAGKHCIDFTQKPFIQNSLFAITGPTGSGKSTILDVIPLALFNKIPRLDSAISKSVMLKQGAILTRGKKEAYARVTYACSQGIFTSEWSVRVASTGTLQDYEMFLYDANGKPITQKKSEVAPKNESLIGLNYDQFIKSVMLAQGEFSKFLKVKKEERSALLEQITGTDIYRKIGIAAFEKYKTYKSSVEDWQKSIVALETKLLTQEEQRSLLENEELLNQQKNKENQALELVKNQLKQWQDFNELKTRIAHIKETLANKRKAIEDFDAQQGKSLLLHEKTESFADELNQFKHLSRTKKELEAQLIGRENLLKEAQEDKQNAKQTIMQWLGQEEMEEAEIPAVLEDFRKKMVALDEQRKLKGSEYNNVKKEINYLLEPLGISYKENINNLLTQRLEEVEFFLNAQEVTSLSKEAYMGEKENLEKKESTLQKADRLASDILHLKSMVGDKINLKNNREEQLKVLPSKIEKLQNIFEKESAQLETLELKIENENLKKSLEDYRNKLEDNEPCPLCGALHHPYATHLEVQDSDLLQQKKQLQQQVDKHKTELIQLKTNQESLVKNVKEIEEALVPLNTQLDTLSKNFKDEFVGVNLDDDFKTRLAKVKTDKKLLDEVYTAVQDKNALVKSLPLIDQLDKIYAEGLAIAKEIKDAIGDIDPTQQTQKLLTQWSRASQHLEQSNKQFEEIKEQAHKNIKQINNLQQTLLPAVLAQGFTDISSALVHRLNAATVLELRQKRQQLANESNELKGMLSANQSNASQLEKALAQTDFDVLKEKQNVMVENLSALDEKLKEIFAQISQHKNYLKEIAILKEKIASENEQSRVWRMLDSLIGDAKGKKFNDFAQDLTLSHLLHLANRRLEQLKSRYLLAQPVQEEDDGLVAIDKDMGNQRRSVRTLSGGESFILSLALALALSDLASRNVRIETLFIDEGFGTLDPETLDKTLDTLERLQQESQKMIGVISHVEALKERIAAQIQLSQNGYGLSEFKIVG